MAFEFESDGSLTVRSWADSGLRISGEPAAVFRDLGPEIARVLLAKEEPSFTTMLRERMRDPSDPESINFRIAGIDPRAAWPGAGDGRLPCSSGVTETEPGRTR